MYIIHGFSCESTYLFCGDTTYYPYSCPYKYEIIEYQNYSTLLDLYNNIQFNEITFIASVPITNLIYWYLDCEETSEFCNNAKYK